MSACLSSFVPYPKVLAGTTYSKQQHHKLTTVCMHRNTHHGIVACLSAHWTHEHCRDGDPQRLRPMWECPRTCQLQNFVDKWRREMQDDSMMQDASTKRLDSLTGQPSKCLDIGHVDQVSRCTSKGTKNAQREVLIFVKLCKQMRWDYDWFACGQGVILNQRMH